MIMTVLMKIRNSRLRLSFQEEVSFIAANHDEPNATQLSAGENFKTPTTLVCFNKHCGIVIFIFF